MRCVPEVEHRDDPGAILDLVSDWGEFGDAGPNQPYHSLLVELRFSGENLGEPGPWLERLSRDTDPAIRAGAARVACERKLPFATWVKRLAKEDPDAGVRQIAEFTEWPESQIQRIADEYAIGKPLR